MASAGGIDAALPAITRRQLRSKATRWAFAEQLRACTAGGGPGGRCCEEAFAGRPALVAHLRARHTADLAARAQPLYHQLVRDAAAAATGHSGEPGDGGEEGSSAATLERLRRAGERVPKAVQCLFDGCGGTGPGSGKRRLLRPAGDPSSTPAPAPAAVLEAAVILFYTYCDVPSPAAVRGCQETVCAHLGLLGKIRVASEGLNATLSGPSAQLAVYVAFLLAESGFSHMTPSDIKVSPGTGRDFTDLVVRVHPEIVPLGLLGRASPCDGGTHLSPAEFHALAQQAARPKPDPEPDPRPEGERDGGVLLLDCRNHYEWRIGRFEGALTPDIRKFSYFPEYVDKNLAAFRRKKVLMYCTGGIRCERASAYLKATGVCDEVYQLDGGIHKYLEAYPNGLYRGKLYVFDERQALAANADVVSTCFFCATPWDRYQKCESQHCHLLLLSCPDCQAQGRVHCCDGCRSLSATGRTRDAGCQCTTRRPRVPQY